jgi:hypothetical protein
MSVPQAAAVYFAAGPFPAAETPVISAQFTTDGWRVAGGQPVSHAALVALRGRAVIAVTLTAGGRSADFQLDELVGRMRPVDAAFADGDSAREVLDAWVVKLCLFGALESEHYIEVRADEPGWARAVCRTHGFEHITPCRGYATEAAAIAGAQECDDAQRRGRPSVAARSALAAAN